MAKTIRMILAVLIVGAAFYLRFENPRMEPEQEPQPRPSTQNPADTADVSPLRTKRLSGVLEDRDHHPVSYHLYIPQAKNEKESFPLLFCMDGQAPNPGGFLGQDWIDFADSQRFAVAALSYLYKESEWKLALGSAKTNDVDDSILNELMSIANDQGPVRNDDLYLFGTSLGARYVVNYAIAHPIKVQAVVAHDGTQYARKLAVSSTHFLLSASAENKAALKSTETLASDFKSVGVVYRQWIPNDKHPDARAELTKQAREFLLESRKD